MEGGILLSLHASLFATHNLTRLPYTVENPLRNSQEKTSLKHENLSVTTIPRVLDVQLFSRF